MSSALHPRHVVFACSLAMLAGCVSRQEVSRVSAPSGEIDAVLVEVNGGATTTFAYTVHVMPTGEEPSGSNRVVGLVRAVRNDSAYGANLVWQGRTLLAVEFLSARSVSFDRPTIDVNGTQVMIAIQEGVTDPSAPGGGMLYNLLRKK